MEKSESEARVSASGDGGMLWKRIGKIERFEGAAERR